MLVICCNCGFGDIENWNIEKSGLCKCPKCNNPFYIDSQGNIKELTDNEVNKIEVLE